MLLSYISDFFKQAFLFHGVQQDQTATLIFP